jgi:polar amino acid transport system substrate-binding protein
MEEKKNMKKLFKNVLLCTVIASLLVLGGCGSNDNATDTSSTKSTDTEDADDTDSTAKDDSLEKVLDAHQLVLGLDATFKPMGYTDENDEIVGFDIDVAEEVCARLGVDLVKEPINWDTKEQDLNLGKIDCIWNGMSINASREKEMNLSEPYMKNSMVFVVPADSDAEEMADLEGANIAVQNGSSAQEILEASDLADSITETSLATNVEALQQMELGLVDAVFLDSVVANYEITSSGKDYVILPDGLEEEEYAIGFRKEDQALRDKVQEILHEMKEDGKLAEISIAWFGSDITTVE